MFRIYATGYYFYTDLLNINSAVYLLFRLLVLCYTIHPIIEKAFCTWSSGLFLGSLIANKFVDQAAPFFAQPLKNDMQEKLLDKCCGLLALVVINVVSVITDEDSVVIMNFGRRELSLVNNGFTLKDKTNYSLNKGHQTFCQQSNCIR